MKNHIIYLITNANRQHIEIGYCGNINTVLLEISQAGQLHFSRYAPLNRIVYTESFHTIEEAQRRKLELERFTHMMKERLIRKHNPNWLSLHTASLLASQSSLFNTNIFK